MIYIKNIIFDLGGVLLKGKSSSVLNNLDLDHKTFSELIKFFVNNIDLDLGNETVEERLKKCGFNNEILNKYKDLLLNYYKYRELNYDLIKILNKLKQNKYNIYILSDNNKEAYEYYKSSKYFKNIDGWVISYEYNTTKKDGILFDIFLKKYNLNPKECYFIDDKLINIEVATKKGIKSFQFNENIDSLLNDMRDNNINI